MYYAVGKSTTATHKAPVRHDCPHESFTQKCSRFERTLKSTDPLDEIVREGAMNVLQAAINAEVFDFITSHLHRAVCSAICLDSMGAATRSWL